MGALDDAIREHLELKRRQGVSEEELKRKEDEAFGRARLGPTTARPAGDELEPAPEPPADLAFAEEEPFEPALDDSPSPQPPLAAPEDVELSEERSLAE